MSTYTRTADRFDNPWYSYTYEVDGHETKAREWAPSLEAGRKRLDARLERMSKVYTGRLPEGAYARNNTISMTNDRIRRKKR